jgi:hypothetical protein
MMQRDSELAHAGFVSLVPMNVGRKPMEKPSGCVIWIVVCPINLEMKSYRWFGGTPGQPLPDITDFKRLSTQKGTPRG